MGTAPCIAPHNHAEFQSEPHMSYYGVGNWSACNRPEQNQQNSLLYVFDDSNNMYKQQRRGCSLSYKWLTAVLSKGRGLHGRCPSTITCSTCITRSYSDIMHQKLLLFTRTDHVKHKIPNYFTHLFFLNSNFCGDKKKVSIIRSDISR